MLKLEDIREEVKMENGKAAETIDLIAAGISEGKRKAGRVTFDRAVIKESDRKEFNKKITLISTADEDGEDKVRVNYYSSPFGTLYPDYNYTAPKYQFKHFQIIDKVRLKYAIARKNERELVQETDQGTDPAENKNEEVIELSYDEAKDMILELNGVGEKTANNVIKAIAKGKTLEEVPYLPDQAKEQIEELLHDGVALV